MKRKRSWGVGLVAAFVVAATTGSSHAADLPAAATPEFEFPLEHNNVDAPTRCYQMALNQGGDIEACNQALAESSAFDDRKRAAAYTNRALIKSYSGNHQAALLDIERALELLPNLPAVLINRGNILWRLHRFDEASESYQRAIDESGGKAALAYYNRIFVHRIRGDVELAVADLERAQRLTQPEDPPDPETLTDRPLQDVLIFQR